MRYRKDSLLEREVLKDPAMIREAIAAGADVNARGSFGNTPLHAACLEGLAPAVELLVAFGAHVNAYKAVSGAIPLHFAFSPAVARFLLEAGADWTLRDKWGRTAVEVFRQRGDVHISRTIEQWAAQKRADGMKEQLETSEAQQGPGL